MLPQAQNIGQLFPTTVSKQSPSLSSILLVPLGPFPVMRGLLVVFSCRLLVARVPQCQLLEGLQWAPFGAPFSSLFLLSNSNSNSSSSSSSKAANKFCPLLHRHDSQLSGAAFVAAGGAAGKLLSRLVKQRRASGRLQQAQLGPPARCQSPDEHLAQSQRASPATTANTRTHNPGWQTNSIDFGRPKNTRPRPQPRPRPHPICWLTSSQTTVARNSSSGRNSVSAAGGQTLACFLVAARAGPQERALLVEMCSLLVRVAPARRSLSQVVASRGPPSGRQGASQENRPAKGRRHPEGQKAANQRAALVAYYFLFLLLRLSIFYYFLLFPLAFVQTDGEGHVIRASCSHRVELSLSLLGQWSGCAGGAVRMRVGAAAV